MKIHALLLLSLLAGSAVAAQAAGGPGITGYSTGRQEYVSFEQIVGMPTGSLRAKLQDMSLHLDWLKSFDEAPFNNPAMYDDVVDETIEQAAAVEAALRESNLAERAQIVAQFKRDVEARRRRQPQPAQAQDPRP